MCIRDRFKAICSGLAVARFIVKIAFILRFEIWQAVFCMNLTNLEAAYFERFKPHASGRFEAILSRSIHSHILPL